MRTCFGKAGLREVIEQALERYSTRTTLFVKDVLEILNQFNGLRYLRWGGDGKAVQPEKS